MWIRLGHFGVDVVMVTVNHVGPEQWLRLERRAASSSPTGPR